jgi:hypothetical protein
MVFLISLPRSGSTLLQRLLMGHAKLATCGEPWLALPLSMMDRDGEAFATYGHFSSARALRNLYENIEGGRDAVMREAGCFMKKAYGLLDHGDAVYFLDKTPRYYKILDDLHLMFPDAKFIFLTREPLAIFGSILNYIEGKVYRLPTWYQDMVEGMPLLSEGLRQASDSTLQVSYESLVSDPRHELERMLSFLDLDFDESILSNLSQREINMGDPFGAKKYTEVSNQSLNAWMQSINSSTKKKVAHAWLSSISEVSFTTFGTTKEQQLSKLRAHRVRFSLRDAVGWLVGATYFFHNFNVVRWSMKRRRLKQHSSVY